MTRLKTPGQLLIILITTQNQITSHSPDFFPHSSSSQAIRSSTILPPTSAFYYLYMIHISLLSPWKMVKWTQGMGFLPNDSPGSNLFSIHGFTGILKLPTTTTKMPKGFFLGPQYPQLGVRGGETECYSAPSVAPSRALGVTLLMWPYCVRDILMCPFDRLERHHCKMTFMSIVSQVFLMPKETHAQLEKKIQTVQKYIILPLREMTALWVTLQTFSMYMQT